jgi:hypothetical protein
MNIAGKKLSNGDLAIAGGLIVALIAIFLPWYGYSYSYASVLGVNGGTFSASVGGLSYWSGWFFLIFTLIGIALFVMRTFFPTVAMPALPVNDSMVYAVIGALMVVMALLWLVAGAPSYSEPGFSAGLSFGLIIGIVGAAAVIAGGFLKRSDPQPVIKPMSAYQTPSAPPPASPPPPPGV